MLRAQPIEIACNNSSINGSPSYKFKKNTHVYLEIVNISHSLIEAVFCLLFCFICCLGYCYILIYIISSDNFTSKVMKVK